MPKRLLPLAGSAAYLLALGCALSVPSHLGAESPAVRTIARWLFDEGKGDVAGDGADGATNGKVIRALWADGRSGKALSFEDYSLKDYLHPKVADATRVVVPHADRLNPAGSFTLRAVIFPTRDPVYYGGIFEKGRGYGASYRLIVLRGLMVRAEIGSALVRVTSDASLSLNAWHDVEMVFDGASVALRIDGKEVGRTPAAPGALNNREDAVIGERFSGRVDEVSLTVP
ncbi:MAG: LamG domain-containing protein [Acidobacteria bacterium]|nr:LamG domain-containing protein [Acidobacteriota bacterium]